MNALPMIRVDSTVTSYDGTETATLSIEQDNVAATTDSRGFYLDLLTTEEVRRYESVGGWISEVDALKIRDALVLRYGTGQERCGEEPAPAAPFEVGQAVIVTGDSGDWCHDFAPGTPVTIDEIDGTDDSCRVEDLNGTVQWVDFLDLAPGLDLTPEPDEVPDYSMVPETEAATIAEFDPEPLAAWEIELLGAAFEPGDRVRASDAPATVDGGFVDESVAGEIGTVDSVPATGNVHVDFGRINQYVGPQHLTKIPVPGFAPGDRVVVTSSPYCGAARQAGAVGTVKEVGVDFGDPGIAARVEVDGDDFGSWAFPEDGLDLVDEKPYEIKVGDRVVRVTDWHAIYVGGYDYGDLECEKGSIGTVDRGAGAVSSLGVTWDGGGYSAIAPECLRAFEPMEYDGEPEIGDRVVVTDTRGHAAAVLGALGTVEDVIGGRWNLLRVDQDTYGVCRQDAERFGLLK